MPQSVRSVLNLPDHVKLSDYTDKSLLLLGLVKVASQEHGEGLLLNFALWDETAEKIAGPVVECICFAPGVVRDLSRLLEGQLSQYYGPQLGYTFRVKRVNRSLVLA